MKYEVITDPQGYLLILRHTGTAKDFVELNLEDYDLSEDRLFAYKLGKNELIFDQSKYDEILDKKRRISNNKEISELKKRLQETDYIMSKWVEEIISLDSPLTWISDVIKINVRYLREYKEILKNRKEWRERIKELND